MVTINGYVLRDAQGQELSRWHELPARVDLPSGDAVFGIVPGWSNGAYSFVATSWEVPEPPPPPPEVIKTAYLKAALAQIGKLDIVNAAVIDPVLKVLWENATEMRRDDLDMARIAAALGIDLDDAWARARNIRVARGGEP